eukprot:6692205-Alexandrium_andersonii.AAC.1
MRSSSNGAPATPLPTVQPDEAATVPSVAATYPDCALASYAEWRFGVMLMSCLAPLASSRLGAYLCIKE